MQVSTGELHLQTCIMIAFWHDIFVHTSNMSWNHWQLQHYDSPEQRCIIHIKRSKTVTIYRICNLHIVSLFCVQVHLHRATKLRTLRTILTKRLFHYQMMCCFFVQVKTSYDFWSAVQEINPFIVYSVDYICVLTSLEKVPIQASSLCSVNLLTRHATF